MDNTIESGYSASSPITQRDVQIVWLKWHAFSETSLNFERLQALAFCNAMTGVLAKLYPDEKDLAKALQRHLTMFNTQANWGSVIAGISIALEEKAAQEPEEQREATTQLVTGLKTGLMGPVSGIGDTLDFGTLRPIVIGVCIPFVIQGYVIAALLPLIYQVVYMFFASRFALNIGYKKGKESILEILHSGSIHRIIEGAGMFGLLMMGALSATYVKIKTPLHITTGGGNTIVLQDMLDKIVPNMLPLIAVLGIYFYIQKCGPYFLRILVTILFLSLAFSFFGVL
ncbi:PTS system mannose/fructose/sorbose family transporter subunit IID [Escherichia marmotae]|uniref:PTS system mannose/fructose/sorbose family transporter subunit IID n=1 Tax=Escherichia marmotae TaxID=1499973 RepID=UPI00164FB288|nr:PTS system mannose/fructose/sorbose family transporter subunit IID [Escherichia marmotae]